MPLLVALHLATVFPAMLLGVFLLVRKKKGDARHKVLGRVWAALMVSTSILSLFMRDHGHFTWLHGLSVLTILAVSRAIYFARKKDIQGHRRNILLAVIGTIVAFVFVFSPNRILGAWVRSMLGLG